MNREDDQRVTWARVKELLDGIMADWKARHGEPMPGIHDYSWSTPEQLADNKPYGRQLIEPGKPARETYLSIFLRKGIGTIPRMPRGGPYLSEEQIEEIERWIDVGMPRDWGRTAQPADQGEADQDERDSPERKAH